MTIYNADYKVPLTLSPNRCRFNRCTFKGTTTRTDFVSIDGSSLRCSFILCFFAQIDVGSEYVIRFYKAAEGIQDRCCYSEVVSIEIYYSTTKLVSESVNSTICTNSKSIAPFCCCSTELTSFFSNHPYLYKAGSATCNHSSKTRR